MPAPESSKAERREARARIAAYHEAELAGLVERLREGFRHYDAGELDVFELDVGSGEPAPPPALSRRARRGSALTPVSPPRGSRSPAALAALLLGSAR